MMSAVRVEQIVDCPFSFVVDQAHLSFPMLENSVGGARVPYRTLGVPASGSFTHRVEIQFRRQRDAAEPGLGHDEIVFDWDAHARWLPNFHSVLRFRIERLRTRVILLGDYQPPFGAFGAVFDRSIGHRLALATACDFMNRSTQPLEARWETQKRMTAFAHEDARVLTKRVTDHE